MQMEEILNIQEKRRVLQRLFMALQLIQATEMSGIM